MSWRDTEARNQTLFRDANERIERVEASFATDGLASFLCECGNRDCTRTIDLSHSEYERVRAYGNRFAVARNHENPESESIVAENGRFAVVETYAGDASRIARESDPRSQQATRRRAEKCGGRA